MALMNASLGGHLDIVKYLMSEGATIDQTSKVSIAAELFVCYIFMSHFISGVYLLFVIEK